MSEATSPTNPVAALFDAIADDDDQSGVDFPAGPVRHGRAVGGGQDIRYTLGVGPRPR
jgi:hypothetical protein